VGAGTGLVQIILGAGGDNVFAVLDVVLDGTAQRKKLGFAVLNLNHDIKIQSLSIKWGGIFI
jgi:hypothetical protein